MEGMKEVIEKIEKKLIASSKIYAAMNYGIWAVILIIYEVIYVPLIIYKPTEAWFTAHPPYAGVIIGVFWTVAVIFLVYVNVIAWKKIKQLKVEMVSKSRRHSIIVGWVVGAAFFWLPMLIHASWASSLGFLLFIISGNIGIYLCCRNYESFATIFSAIIAIPFIFFASLDMAWFLAVGFVAGGYAISTMLYLWSTFKLVGEQ